MPKPVITTRVPETMNEALLGVSAATGWSMGEMTRMALGAYFAEGGGWEAAKERADQEFAETARRLHAIEQLPALIAAALKDNEQFQGRSRTS